MICAWCERPLTGRQRRYCSVSCKTYVNLKAWRKRTKQRAIEYKGGKCQRCGYNKSVRALSFHHRDGKLFGIGASTRQCWETIWQELDKCDLLCANCHAEAEDEKQAARSTKAVQSLDKRSELVRF